MSRVQGTDMLSAFKLSMREKYLAIPGNLPREKKQGFIERNTKEVHDCNLWDKMIAQFVACMFLQQNTKTSRRSIFTLICHCSFSHVSHVRHTGTNRIPHRSPALLSAGCSGTMTSILLDISVKITIFLRKDISRRNGFRPLFLSRSSRVSLIFGYAGMRVAGLEMCRRIAIFYQCYFQDWLLALWFTLEHWFRLCIIIGFEASVTSAGNLPVKESTCS